MYSVTNLFRQQRKKWKEERYAGHTEHVSEIGACSHEHILQSVRKGRPPFAHTLHKNAEIFFKQNDIRRFFGNIDGALDGNANIGGMKCRGIVDAVSHV